MALIIESETSMQARGAKPLAEVISGETFSDAMGIFPIEPDGKTLSRGIESILKKASVSSSDVGMVTAHANGNKASDVSESKAINHVLGEKVPVTGFKWAIGHNLAASGLLDVALTVKSLEQGFVPGIANFQTLCEDCSSISVSADTQPLNGPVAMTICRGFGGLNTAILLKACDNG